MNIFRLSLGTEAYLDLLKYVTDLNWTCRMCLPLGVRIWEGGGTEGHGLMSFCIHWTTLRGLFFFPINVCQNLSVPLSSCLWGKRFLLVLPLLLPACLPFYTLEPVLRETVTYNEFY